MQADRLISDYGKDLKSKKENAAVGLILYLRNRNGLENLGLREPENGIFKCPDDSVINAINWRIATVRHWTQDRKPTVYRLPSCTKVEGQWNRLRARFWPQAKE